MKLRYKFVINEVADQMVAVVIGDDLEKFNGFVKMNDIGAYIFKKLENDVTEDMIVADMVKDYPDATEAEIRETVSGFITGLKEKDLITE